MKDRSKSRVPSWAMVLAAVVFVGAQVLFHTLITRGNEGPQLPLAVFLGLVMGSVLATLIVLVGFVNVDAGRRGMNRTLWTLIAIFVPNGIGLILYFVLRRPLESACVQCGAPVSANVNYCPRCGQRLALLCPHCGQAFASTDLYCGKCGQPLSPETKVQV